jgi:hypothetical protein
MVGLVPIFHMLFGNSAYCKWLKGLPQHLLECVSSLLDICSSVFFKHSFSINLKLLEWRLQQVCQSAVPSTLFTSLLKPLNPFVHVCAIYAGTFRLCYHMAVYVFWWNLFRNRKSNYIMLLIQSCNGTAVIKTNCVQPLTTKNWCRHRQVGDHMINSVADFYHRVPLTTEIMNFCLWSTPVL